jgi:hypothetical protein
MDPQPSTTAKGEGEAISSGGWIGKVQRFQFIEAAEFSACGINCRGLRPLPVEENPLFR